MYIPGITWGQAEGLTDKSSILKKSNIEMLTPHLKHGQNIQS